MQPEFIDNRNGNTLARALAQILGGNVQGGVAEEKAAKPAELAVASAFFSPRGLVDLTPHLNGMARIRLMFGVEAPRDVELRRPELGETEQGFERRLVRDGLRQAEKAARMARDRFPFTEAGIDALRRLVAKLRGHNIEVRRYERTFMHAKAYIFQPAAIDENAVGGAIVGSSNLTGGGLARNLELNLGRYDPPTVQRARSWFDALWEEAEPVDLAELYEEIFIAFRPWDIFLRILYQLYGSEIAELEAEDRGLPLTSFQQHGVARALRLIRDCGGAIVADEVGLGKTFIAGEVIGQYFRRRQRALLICPAQLRDTTWKKFLARWNFELSVECVSFEELANDVQLAEGERQQTAKEHLLRPLAEYQLVVVDEAHNYRNPDAATRAAVLRRLLFGQKRDLLLLTATPVNNSLWDLFHLIRFYVRQDAFLANRGVLSIHERFQHAMRIDPSNLSPDLLYPVIDATCVKRTRQFVKKHYEGDTIRGPDGREQPIIFPTPRAITIRYPLTDPMPELFDEIETALDPDGGPETLSLARYSVELYAKSAHDPEQENRLAAVIGLVRSGLLKRFESSPYAFVQTLDKLIHGHELFLQALAKGYVINSKFIKDIAAEDESNLDELLKASEETLPASGFETGALATAVKGDLAILRSLIASARKITPDNDPKLKALVAELEKISAEATEQATDAIDAAQRRKVLLFSFFADTVAYVRAHLRSEIARNPNLKAYEGRIIAVSGGDDLEEISRQKAIYGFAPISTEAPPGQDADLFDLLVTTDVLAEGVNLQQCRHIINLDVPWNPMRMVQRHGRIDRIGSRHTRVFLRTIFPAERLDRLLNLEQRILNKIALAAASIGVASPVAGAAHGNQVFTETREEIEKLLNEDAALYERGGTAGAAQTGEEYRQTLRKALAENRERIVSMPWKAGSGLTHAKEQGVVFCAAVGNRTYLRFVRADNTWIPMGGEGAITGELGACLKLVECEPATPRTVPSGLEDGAIFDFWTAAQDDIWRSWMIETDPANLQPKIRPLNRRVAEFIRANVPPDFDNARLTLALNIVESPWPRREENLLREWFEDESRTGAIKAKYLCEQIMGTGIEPFREPPTLPPITTDEIELICWMAIVRAGSADVSPEALGSG